MGFLEGEALWVFGDAAVDADGVDMGGGGDSGDLVVDLDGEFAGGGYDDGAGRRFGGVRCGRGR